MAIVHIYKLLIVLTLGLSLEITRLIDDVFRRPYWEYSPEEFNISIFKKPILIWLQLDLGIGAEQQIGDW